MNKYKDHTHFDADESEHNIAPSFYTLALLVLLAIASRFEIYNGGTTIWEIIFDGEEDLIGYLMILVILLPLWLLLYSWYKSESNRILSQIICVVAGGISLAYAFYATDILPTEIGTLYTMELNNGSVFLFSALMGWISLSLLVDIELQSRLASKEQLKNTTTWFRGILTLIMLITVGMKLL